MFNSKRGFIVFTDDDAHDNGIDRFANIIKEKNIRMSFGVPTSPTILHEDKVNKLLKLQNEYGCEIMAHGHLAGSYGGMTLSELDDDMKISTNILKEKGFYVNGIIYPGARYDEEVDVCAKKYFKYGCGHTDNYNKENINPYKIIRVGLGSYFANNTFKNLIGSPHSTDTYEFLLDCVDFVDNNNACIVFMTHGATLSNEWVENIKMLIDYIRSKNNTQISTVGEFYKCITPSNKFVDTEGLKVVLNSINNKFEKTKNTSKFAKLTNTLKTFKIGCGYNDGVLKDYSIYDNNIFKLNIDNKVIANVYTDLLNTSKYKTKAGEFIIDSDNFITVNINNGIRVFSLIDSAMNIKPSTKYTFLLDVIENTSTSDLTVSSTSVGGDISYWKTTVIIKAKETGKKNIIVESLSDFTSVNCSIKTHTLQGEGSIKYRVMIIEGEYPDGVGDYFPDTKPPTITNIAIISKDGLERKDYPVTTQSEFILYAFSGGTVSITSSDDVVSSIQTIPLNNQAKFDLLCRKFLL